MAEQIPWDWLSAQQRLGQGRISDPSQDRLSASDTPDWWWQQQRYRERQTPGLIERPEDVSALPFGDLADPVSQAAFLMAPGMVRGSKALLETLDSPGPSLMRRGMLAGERGNLGPPPMSATGEALPESMVRDETGQLQRLYHGTSRVFPDFDMAQSGSGAGGDLYGPGIYMTAEPAVAEGYSQAGQPVKDVLVTGQSWNDTIAALRKQRINPMGKDVFVNQINRGETEAGKEVYEAVRFTVPPANIRPVYADLKRPFDIDGVIPPEQAKALLTQAEHPIAKNPNNLKEWIGKQPDKTLSGLKVYTALQARIGKEAANKMLAEAGYDGITHIGGSVTGGQPHRVYIAFSPEHVYPSVNVDALRGMSTKMK